MEVFYFSKDAKSLHFGEYPAKVHWPTVPDPVSNPCCRRVADVIGKKYALVDVMPMRSKGLSGDISFTVIIKELMKDGAYVRALEIYLKYSIQYFSAATVFPVWGQVNAKLVSALSIGVELLPMAHPSGHEQRSSPTHYAKVLHDLLQTVIAHVISPHDIEGYMQSLVSIEAERVKAHRKDIDALGMRSHELVLLRPAILHLVEQEWVKRIELVSFLKEQSVKTETLEVFFCASSIRYKSVQDIKKGITDFACDIRHDFPSVCERAGSSGNSVVPRLVDDPKLFLASLQTIAAQLGQAPDQVWTTVCASGDSAVARLVDDPKLFLASLETVTALLGQAPDQVWTTVCWVTALFVRSDLETHPPIFSIHPQKVADKA